MTNRELIERYPWLRITNRLTGEYVEGAEGTELDLMPSGWRVAFGEQMCAEIHQELMTWPREQRKKFRIRDIKEKWAHLCVYTNLISPGLREITNRYTNLSKTTCIYCGGPARWITRGWYMPICDKCAREAYDNNTWKPDFKFEDEYMDIDEYYKKED